MQNTEILLLLDSCSYLIGKVNTYQANTNRSYLKIYGFDDEEFIDIKNLSRNNVS